MKDCFNFNGAVQQKGAADAQVADISAGENCRRGGGAVSGDVRAAGSRHQAIACIDCHDPETMALRITRPAFMEGIAAAKAHERIEDYDVNTMASRQEMRSYICAQCHVEYYFAGEEKRLTYPWSKGLTVDGAYDYFEEIGFKDWMHA